VPSRLPGQLRERLAPIKLLVLDVDGVLTDGSLYYSGSGEELKRFSVRDGLAIRLLEEAGLAVGIITGRRSGALRARCRDLGIRDDLVIQGSSDKGPHLDRLEAVLGIEDHQVAAMGDDLPDLPVLERAAFSACPADAAPEVAAACHWVCGAVGGSGAVREVAELILKAQRRWQDQVGRWLGPDVGEKGDGP
jgi:3-deoxy-D-manno-octulosonate 8-phosphate phosphatase (KDO 8-P phosphatase)